MMNLTTIKEGDQALVLNDSGRARIIIGPRIVWLKYDEELEYMPRHVASQDQYLIVKHKDGHKEHIAGPREMFMNRFEVDRVLVKNALKIDANHLIVVYRQEEEQIQRRIVQGPTIYVPDAHEWLHEFVWHGSNRSEPGRLLPRMNIFNLLRCIPSQIYVNVRDVRTNDDTLIIVKLMVFFELKDIDRMLDYTHDPIADFVNAVQSDVIKFGSHKSYEEFLQHTNDLNKLDTYSQLLARSAHIGYTIRKVVYRGYVASQSLQATHDDAVQTRTHLRLKTEAEEQEQKLKKFKLKREKERTILKQEMERKVQEHKQELERLQQATKLDKQKLIHEAKLKKEAATVEMKLEIEKAEHEQKTAYLSKLQELGVDMTRYLVAMRPEFVPEKEVVVGPAANVVRSVKA